MNTAINIAAAASESNDSFSSGLTWKRSRGFVRSTIYTVAFAVVNFLVITAFSYDYALAYSVA